MYSSKFQWNLKNHSTTRLLPSCLLIICFSKPFYAQLLSILVRFLSLSLSLLFSVYLISVSLSQIDIHIFLSLHISVSLVCLTCVYICLRVLNHFILHIISKRRWWWWLWRWQWQWDDRTFYSHSETLIRHYCDVTVGYLFVFHGFLNSFCSNLFFFTFSFATNVFILNKFLIVQGLS